MSEDEFAIIVEPENGDSVEKLAARLLVIFRQPVEIDGIAFKINLSVGFAHFPDHADQADQLLRAADMAMYQMKGRGPDDFAVVGVGLGCQDLGRADAVLNAPARFSSPLGC